MNPPRNKVVLDTNLLLLWLVARTDPRLLKEFKRVRMFTYPDIQILQDMLDTYAVLMTTPHILSETSNFIDQAPSWRRSALVEQLKKFIQGVHEVHVPAEVLVHKDEFNALGLTDTGMAQLSAKAVVITTDYHLAGRITATGGHAVNFNHYRSSLLFLR